jgi:hypothetical protein
MQERVDRHRRPQISLQTGFGAGEPLWRHPDHCEVQTIEADISAYQLRSHAAPPKAPA